jgi:hypothetical protein
MLIFNLTIHHLWGRVLIRFCEVTRLQYISSHIILDNHCVLQQHHVDYKIANVLLKKGTKQDVDGWDTSRKGWTHMVLHLPHTEGCYGVTFHDVTNTRPSATS